MEPITNAPGTVKGLEVLYFEEAEVYKMKDGKSSYATFGPMSVLYFKDYNRFVLQINDWKYPILRRHNITSDHSDPSSHFYMLPTTNGFSFHLKLTKIPSPAAMSNLETILLKKQSSPDDKLKRPLKCTKKRSNLKDIKNKDFKKEASSKIEKDFFETSEKSTHELLQKRKENVNLSQIREFDDLLKAEAPTMLLPKGEIEEAILSGKDMPTESSAVKGVEVLYFEEAEVAKMKGSHTAFATFGPLSVLYFKDYNRFLLQLNDWRFPILKRLNYTSERGTYILPAKNGFLFRLKISRHANPAAVTNLETILLKKQNSPDDKLKRILKCTRKRSFLKDIKNKDFKKEASSKIEKDFFETSEKSTHELLQKRRENINLSQIREFDDLLKTSDSDTPTMFLPKEEIEEAILSGKDMPTESSTVKGIEVLFFEEAEVFKTKDSKTSYATFGSLSLLYFKDYQRFVLQINDWRYPLLRRLSITPDHSDPNTRSYMLPSKNGFSFHLKINKASNPAAFSNLDTILLRKVEASPDDKLRRPALKATKKRSFLKDIKNKDFKKDASSRIKKDFFEASEKSTSEFMRRRRENTNLAELREFDDLMKTPETHAPIMYLSKEEIEEAILAGKESPAHSSPKATHATRERTRERNMAPEVHAEKIPVAAEGLTHYQG